MNTTKKELSKTRVEITIKLGAAELGPASAKAISRLASELKIAGFRKGKVPLDVAKKHIPDNDVATQTLDVAVRTAIPEAFERFKVISMPEVTVDKYVPGELLEFRATADVLPEVKLGAYKSLKVKKPDAKLDPKSVDEVLGNIAQSFAETKVVNRAAKLTDEVQIDFVGKEGGVAFEGGTAKDFKLVLGSGQFIPGFEEGIVGKKPGDKFTLELTFPKDYHAAQLAGKKVTFETLLKQVNEVVAPKLDDALAAKAGPFKTLAALKADIEKNLEAQAAYRSAEQYKDDLVAELVKNSDVAAPAILIDDQMRAIRLDFEQDLKGHGLSEDQYFEQSGASREDWEKSAKVVAEARVKSALVLQTLAAELGIEASAEETAAKVAELKDAYKKNPEAVQSLSDSRAVADIKNRLAIEKTLDALVKLNS